MATLNFLFKFLVFFYPLLDILVDGLLFLFSYFLPLLPKIYYMFLLIITDYYRFECYFDFLWGFYFLISTKSVLMEQSTAGFLAYRSYNLS